MNKVELLAPAGSMEALHAAVQNGCDAVYLGGPGFGARAFADNFDEAGLIEAITYAHWYGVKVYVTVNTLINEEELASILTYIRMLQSIDVDALIIQDLGLLDIVLRQFPEMEAHASTQMHVHNEEAIRFLSHLGVQRIVVPRETPLEEIREMAKLGVDLEVFVQGALCVSYSGQCLMSSVLFQRSGNRGACAQPCRMQYELLREGPTGMEHVKSEGDYLLSPKDLNVLSSIGDLIDAGVASFKIEGRMKRPEYVAYITRLYRQAIDAHLAHQSFHVTAAMLEEMEKLFHRGFTKGHIYHQMGSALMNPIRPNHMGIVIGTVIEVKKDKMKIQLTHALDQGDGIRILNDKKDEGFRANFIYVRGLLVNHADANEIIELDRVMGIQKGAVVLKTSEEKQLKELQKSYEGYIRKVMIEGSFVMLKQQKPMLSVWDEDGTCCSVEGVMDVEQARKTPLTIERLQQQFQKTKDTPVQFSHIEYSIDEDATMPISELNRMRREAIEQLLLLRSNRHGVREERGNEDCVYPQSDTNVVHVVVRTQEQFEVCKEKGVKVYVDDFALYQTLRQQHQDVAYRNPRVRKSSLHQGIVQDVGGIQTQSIADTSLNVCNHRAGNFLFAQGITTAICSWEVEKETAIQMAQHGGVYGYAVYGKRELMISDYCVINATEKDSNKKACGLCKQHHYYLKDRKARVFPIICDDQCRMHVLEEDPFDRIHEIQELKAHGIHQFLCVFTNEETALCLETIDRILDEVAR